MNGFLGRAVVTAFGAFALLAPLAPNQAMAEPVVGLGLTLWFGGGQTQTAIGLRLFSDDENQSVVGSVGVDYVLGAGAIRPTLGLAYLQDDAYLGLDVGFDLQGGPLRFGAGLGATQTSDPAPAPAPAGGGGGGGGGGGA